MGYRSRHRGYQEFLEPITGAELTFTHWALDRKIGYFRFGRHVDRKTGKPKGELWSRLGDYNVYSIADLGGGGKAKQAAREAAVVSATRQWLQAHPSFYPDLPLPPGARSDAKPQKKTNLSAEEIFDLVWDLDESDPEVAKFLYGEAPGKRITGPAARLNYDHHCGILYRRKDGALFTFPADGGTQNGPLILEKSFANAFMERKLLYLAIWRVKPLRPGGYAPPVPNDGRISTDNPSRLIEWKEGTGKPLPGSKPVKKKG